MTATGNEAVSIAQLKDYAANQGSGGGESAFQVFTATSESNEKTVEMNGWKVNVPGGTGGTYVFLVSNTSIVLHAMRFTAKPSSGNMTISHSSAQNLKSSVTAYTNSAVSTTCGWPISGAPTRYSENSNVTSDILEVMNPDRNRVIIKIVEANDLDGYSTNINFNVNFCVWIA